MNLKEVKGRLEAAFNATVQDSVMTVEVEHKTDLAGTEHECYIRGFVPDEENYDDEQILDMYLRPMVVSFAQQCNRLSRDGHEIQYLARREPEDTNCIILDTEPELKVAVEWRNDVKVDDEEMAGLVFSVEAEIGEASQL